MHAKIFLVLGAIASLTNVVSGQGFIIPQNQTDGVYVVSADTEGNTVHDIVSRDLNEKSSLLSVKFQKRATLPISDKGCKTAILTNLDIQTAVDQLSSYCGSGNGRVMKTIGVYSIAGGAAAYMCNYTGGDNPCSREELDQMVTKVSQLCPDNQAGWVYMKDWNKGYGYDSSNSALCWGKLKGGDA